MAQPEPETSTFALVAFPYAVAPAIRPPDPLHTGEGRRYQTNNTQQTINNDQTTNKYLRYTLDIWERNPIHSDPPKH